MPADPSLRPPDHLQAPLEQHRAWGPSTTVNDAIEGWRDNGWEDLSPKTVRGYEEIWRGYIRDSIGPELIASLSPYDIERFFRNLKSAGAGKDTVRRVRTVLHRACRLAERWSGGTVRNPAADTELPAWSLSEMRAPVRSPTVEEVRRLLSAADAWEPRFSVFLRVLAATGMRRAEACALRWCDVDFERGTVRIDEAVVAAVGGAMVKGPKTRASVRTVAVDADTLEAMATLRQRRPPASASPTPGDCFVFSSEPGGSKPPHPDSMSHAFIKVRTRAAISGDIHLHSLRHFHATVLDPVISEAQKQTRLGWSTVTMARHYTDGTPEEDRRAADYLGKVLRSLS